MAGQAVSDLRQQIGVADHDFSAAVGKDIGDLFGLQMPVDRHDRAAECGGRAETSNKAKSLRSIMATGLPPPTPRQRNPVAARAIRAWISG